MRLLLENAILNDLIILFMLILDNLSYQAAKKTFQNSSKKLIKFEVSTLSLIQTSNFITFKLLLKSKALPSWNGPNPSPYHSS